MRPLKKWLFLLVFFIGILLCPVKLLADNGKTAVLLTLEWPPYTGIKLPDTGSISKRVHAAYAAQGQKARIGFFSWRRAIRLPYTDHRFTGFFPAYPSAERKQVCHLSEPIGISPVGLAELRNKPLRWTRVEELANYRIGVVTAYEDTFDRLVKDGSIKTTSSETDAENLIRLLTGRVDGIVIDTNTFSWLLKNDARLRAYRSRLQMNERLLVTWPLYVCFRKDPEGAALRDYFNAGLSRLNDEEPLSQGDAGNSKKLSVKKRR